MISKNKYILFVFFLSICNTGFTQTKANQDKFLIVKIGQGITHGGYGLNVEFRKNHFGNYICAGYKNKIFYDNYTVPGSYNYGVGFNYFFFNKKSIIKPRAGLHLGWLSNYYDDRIGITDYSQIVYGAAILSGLEFSDSFMYFNIGFALDPGFAIVDERRHPYYSGQMYMSMIFSFGVDLFGFAKAVKDKRIKPSKQDIEYENEKDEYEIADKGLEEINNTCFSYSELPNLYIPKGFCNNETIFQQVNQDSYIVIKINPDLHNKKSYFSSEFIDTLNKNVVIKLISNVTGNICSESSTGKEYKALEGTIVYSIKQEKSNQTVIRKMSVLLKNLKLKNKEEIIYYDEILICNLAI